MVEVGDVAMKIAGRDAGGLCIVVEILKDGYVMIDGETRRRKCNFNHLEFLNRKVKLKKSASGEDVRKGLKDLGFKIKEVEKGKAKEKKEKPKQIRKSQMKSKPLENKKAKAKK